MSSTNSEAAVAAIPTDQHMLKLLQELVARVKKLESRNEAEGDNILAETTGEETILTNEENALLTSRNPSIQSCYCGLPEDSHISLPYGYLLDGEDATDDLTSISERYAALTFSGSYQGNAQLLKPLGIAGIPADGRMPLCVAMLWWPECLKYRKEACDAYEDLERRGGIFLAADFVTNGRSVIYRYQVDETDRFEFSRLPYDFLNIWTGGRIDAPPITSVARSSLQHSAPWKRFIVVEGLSAASKKTQDFFREYFMRIPGPSAILSHLEAASSYTHYSSVNRRRYWRFHLSWYEVSDSDLSRRHDAVWPSSSWKRGELHGDPDMLLFQKAHTILTASDEKDEFWTILLLSPPEFTKIMRMRGGFIDPTQGFVHASYQVNMLTLILIAITETLYGWKSLHSHIGRMLGTGEEIFNINAHDKMIFDDDLFTRSRKYFWTINCLQESDNLIRLNIETWNQYQEPILRRLRRMEAASEVQEEGEVKALREGISRCQRVVAQLADIRKLFKDQRQKAVSLRDGLFSASAVMESRASTRLGKNVMLLTYVSIFYLPLGFCTSIWSTTATFGFYNLVYTMVGVGLLTYITVFNLNHIIIIGKKCYEYIKTRTVERMRKEDSPSWKDTGDLFHRYEPKGSSDTTKPSEWWILVYQMRRIADFVPWRKSKGSTRNGREPNENTTRGPKLRWLDGLFRSRRVKKRGEILSDSDQV